MKSLVPCKRSHCLAVLIVIAGVSPAAAQFGAVFWAAGPVNRSMAGTNGTVISDFADGFAQSVYWHSAFFRRFRRMPER